MTRDELLKVRDALLTTVTKLDKLGDYDANAPHIREVAKTLLALLDHHLARMPRRS